MITTFEDFARLESMLSVFQFVDAHLKLVGRCHHQHRSVGQEANEPEIFDKLDRPVELVLEGIFAVSLIVDLADVTSVEVYARS